MSEQERTEVKKSIIEQLQGMDEDALRKVLDFLSTVKAQVKADV